jgi:hypothetical protein
MTAPVDAVKAPSDPVAVHVDLWWHLLILWRPLAAPADILAAPGDLVAAPVDVRSVAAS